MSESQAVFAWIASILSTLAVLLVTAWAKHVNTRLEKLDVIDRRLLKIEIRLGVKDEEMA